MTSKPAPDLGGLCDRLVALWRRSPAQYRAIDRRVTDALVATRGRGQKSFAKDVAKNVVHRAFEKPSALGLSPRPRSLQGRLQAAHACPKNDRGYVQLQGSASGLREWRCEGCGKVVTLERSRS
jgi:hypothetical protein